MSIQMIQSSISRFRGISKKLPLGHQVMRIWTPFMCKGLPDPCFWYPTSKLRAENEASVQQGAGISKRQRLVMSIEETREGRGPGMSTSRQYGEITQSKLLCLYCGNLIETSLVGPSPLSAYAANPSSSGAAADQRGRYAGVETDRRPESNVLIRG